MLEDYKLVVEVKTGKKQAKIVSTGKGMIVVELSSVPQKGKANVELLRLLKKETGKDYRIVSGFSGKRKVLKQI